VVLEILISGGEGEVESADPCADRVWRGAAFQPRLQPHLQPRALTSTASLLHSNIATLLSDNELDNSTKLFFVARLPRSAQSNPPTPSTTATPPKPSNNIDDAHHFSPSCGPEAQSIHKSIFGGEIPMRRIYKSISGIPRSLKQRRLDHLVKD